MNVNVDAKDAGKFLKDLPYKAIMLIITVVSALLIFLPDVALEKMFLLDLRNKIGTFLGLIFIFSACLTIYLFVSPKLRKRRMNKALSGEKAKRRIEELPYNEKCIIAYMYHNQNKSIVLPSTAHSVLHLQSQLMINVSGGIGSQYGMAQLFPFHIEPWVIWAVEKTPDLLNSIPPQLPAEFENYQMFGN